MTEEYRICKRCVMDTSLPGIRFDDQGVCEYCYLHDKLDEIYPLDQTGQERFEAIIRRMKKLGKGRKYDVAVGLSGGRDSTYTLYLAKQLGLRPLAVYFNDGFGNPVAGQNMKKASRKLKVDIRTITADWRESKDLKIAVLKASIPELNLATDLGIGTALYGVAAKERIRFIWIGQSFRTEGIAPIEWRYMDGRYLRSVHSLFGKIPLRPWRPTDPGFNLDWFQMVYYTLWRRIATVMPLYYHNYVRSEVDELLSGELGWVNTGAHYYDDLYQALLTYVNRVKFNIDRRRFNYGALVRSGQMTREEALERLQNVYVLEDPKVIDLCLKRLGMTKDEFDDIMAQPPKNFHDYKTLMDTIQKFKKPIGFMAKAGLLPRSTYLKYLEDVMAS